MRLLTEYLSTKVVNPLPINFREEFPNKPKFDEITAFFNNLGFIDLSEKYKKCDFDVDLFMRNEAKKSTNPIYVYQKLQQNENQNVKTYWIRFCNYGAITKENPVLFVYASNDGEMDEAHELLDVDYVAYDITNNRSYKTFNDFMELMKKHFSF